MVAPGVGGISTLQPHSVSIETPLDALRRQRIGIQRHYAQLNTGPDIFSPGTQSWLLKTLGRSATVAVVFLSTAGWITFLIGGAVLDLDVAAWTASVATASALGLIARAADEGLQNEADADRYLWYTDAIEEIQRDFDKSDRFGKVDALRRLEHVSYQELRRFLRTHCEARFLM